MDKRFFNVVVLLVILKSFGGEIPAINVHADHFFQMTVINGSK